MPRYFIRPVNLWSANQFGIDMFAVVADRIPREGETEIYIDNLDLLNGALAQKAEFRNKRSDYAHHQRLFFRDVTVDDAVAIIVSVNKYVKHLMENLQEQSAVDYHQDYIEAEVIEEHISRIGLLTEQYGDELSLLEHETQNAFGQLFWPYIDFTPDDDLTRQYSFLGGSRNLVIPKLGNYERINLPEDLTCQSSNCRLGYINRLVNSMNAVVGQIDWQCLQIAHKMRDHQETTIPNGPYWVVCAQNDEPQNPIHRRSCVNPVTLRFQL